MSVVKVSPEEQKARANRFDAQVSVNLSQEELAALMRLVGETNDGDAITALHKLELAFEAGRRMGKW